MGTRQGTTEKHPAKQGTTLKGPPGSDGARLREAFPAGSSDDSEFKIPTHDEVVQMGRELIQQGTVEDGFQVPGTFDRDFSGAPNFEDVKTGGGGLPRTPKGPGIASPGPGSVNPADIPEGPEPFQGGGQSFPRGDSGANPSDTSKEVAKQSLGSLIRGKSYKGSDIGVE